MANIACEETIKTEISNEKLEAIKEALISGGKKSNLSLKEGDETNELKLQGQIGQLIDFKGIVTITPNKKGNGYSVELSGNSDKTTMVWVYVGISTLLFIISFFAFWPLCLVSIGMDIAIFMMGPSGANGKRKINKTFESLVEFAKDEIR